MTAIVKNLVFETAVTKVQQGRKGEFTTGRLTHNNPTQTQLRENREADLARKLVVGNEKSKRMAINSCVFAGHALIRLCVAVAVNNQLIDINFLSPTSNLVEGLISAAKRIFSSKRKHLLSRTHEQLLFLRANREP